MAIAAVLAAAPAGAQEGLQNGSFDTDLSGWEQRIFDGSTIEWSPFDAAGSEASGSVRFQEDGTTAPNSVRIQQCIPIEPGVVYDVAGSYYIPTQTVPGSATLAVLWNTGLDCAGDLVGDQPRELPSFPMDVWTRLELPDLEAPAEAAAVEILVGAAFADETGAFEIYWDDVTLVPEPAAAVLAWAAGLTLVAVRALRPGARGPAAGGSPSRTTSAPAPVFPRPRRSRSAA